LKVGDDKLWTDKYSLNYIMIPSFLTNEIATKILLTGKAVNFIRRCCQEDDWILDSSESMPFNFENNGAINNSETLSDLKIWVDHAYMITSK